MRGVRKFDRITAYLEQLNGWLSVKGQIRYRDLLLTFKCINGMAPEYLSKNVSTHSSVHGREIRNRNTLYILIFKTGSGQRAFKYDHQSKKLTTAMRLSDAGCTAILSTVG